MGVSRCLHCVPSDGGAIVAGLAGTSVGLAQTASNGAAQVHIEAARKAASMGVHAGLRSHVQGVDATAGVEPARCTAARRSARVRRGMPSRRRSSTTSLPRRPNTPSWAVTTSQGIIIIDAIFDYSIEDEVVGGMKKLGPRPRTDQCVLVSHGHGDHFGRRQVSSQDANAARK